MDIILKELNELDIFIFYDFCLCKLSIKNYLIPDSKFYTIGSLLILLVKAFDSNFQWFLYNRNSVQLYCVTKFNVSFKLASVTLMCYIKMKYCSILRKNVTIIKLK